MTEPAPTPSLVDRGERLELSAPATPDILDLVHLMMEHLWSTHDVAGPHRARFETAVIEVLGNIVEHATSVEAAGATGRRFNIVLDVSDSDVVARLGDDGIPMALDLSAVTMPGELAEEGRGLALAQAALDRLSYVRVDGRNVWDLVVLRGGD